jgi:hypothetical protein
MVPPHSSGTPLLPSPIAPPIVVRWLKRRLEMRGASLKYDLALVLTVAACAGGQPNQLTPAHCPLPASDAGWIQDILNGWTRASRAFLQIDPVPLPRMVLFDTSCEWHLGHSANGTTGFAAVDTPLRIDGRPVSVQARMHDGNVSLPNGSRIPAEIVAVAMPGAADEAFLVLALPEVWQRHPQASQDPHLEIRIASAALHEMIHTRQLPDLRRRVSALAEEFELPPSFDDDVVEHRFGELAEYGSMFAAERDLLYAAVAEPDQDRSAGLTAQALDIAERRRARFFVGSDRLFAELEGLFLNMEGLAEWVRFKSHQSDSVWPHTDADIIAFIRGRDNSWSQDEGLALMLLLDRFVSDWQGEILNPLMPSPLDLLREAVQARE